MDGMARPQLIIVSGPAGTGKTTLAHELARAIGCPAVCRDEIKEGMAHQDPNFRPAPGDPLTRRTFMVFFEVLRLLLSHGVTVVAEATFQDKIWRPNLEPLRELASLKVVQCHADHETARKRIAARAQNRTAHADKDLLDALDRGERYFEDFQRLDLGVPSIDVETTSGYDPPLDKIVEFIDGSVTSR